MKLWCTEFDGPEPGSKYGGVAQGATRENVEEYVRRFPRGPNEQVLGELGATVEMTPDGPITQIHNGRDDDPELRAAIDDLPKQPPL